MALSGTDVEFMAGQIEGMAGLLAQDRSSRDISLAQTHLEDAALRLRRHLAEQRALDVGAKAP